MGVETTLGVTHFGHYVLTMQLLPILQATRRNCELALVALRFSIKDCVCSEFRASGRRRFGFTLQRQRRAERTVELQDGSAFIDNCCFL